MSSSDPLFDLIKSMNKPEKRFFKLSSSIHGGSKNYLKLFDALDVLEEYDEERLKKKLEKEKFLRNNFYKEKGHLYQLILTSLNDYNGQRTEFRIKELLKSVIILKEKNLVSQAIKILQKAKKLALEYDAVHYMPEILSWEKWFVMESYDLEKIWAFLPSFRKETNEASEALRNWFDSLYFQTRVSSWSLKVQNIRSTEEEEQLEEIQRGLQELENKKLSFEARKSLYFACSSFNKLKNNFGKQREYAGKTVQLIESFPLHMVENPLPYVSALNNLLLVQISMRLKEEVPETIRKMRELAEKPEYRKLKFLKVVIFRFSYPIELEHYIVHNEIEKAVELVPVIEKGLEEYGENLGVTTLIILRVIVTKVFIISGNFKKALEWLKPILDDGRTKPGSRDDLYSFAKIFNLIIHYELGNRDLLEYTVRSTYRFLYKKKRLFKAETCILDFIRKLPFVQNDAQLKSAFRDLREQMLPLREDPYEKHAFEALDYIEWLEKKIEALPGE